jgi:hypothetical protein
MNIHSQKWIQNASFPDTYTFETPLAGKRDVHTMSILLDKFQEDPPGRRTSDVFCQNPRIRPCSAIPREQRTHFRHRLINTHNISRCNDSVTGYGAQTSNYHVVSHSKSQHQYCCSIFKPLIQIIQTN